MTPLNSLTKLLGIGLLAAMFSWLGLRSRRPEDGVPISTGRQRRRCQTCHGTDLKNPNLPTEETCTQCHPKAALIEKTKDLPGANPHNAPHNGDCVNCHLMHEPPEDLLRTVP